MKKFIEEFKNEITNLFMQRTNKMS